MRPAARPSPAILAAITAPLVLMASLSAAAAQAMTAEEFDSYTRGKTLSYSWMGQEFGKEQYLPGRRVVWAFTGEECRRGSWYEDAGNICFVYDDDPAPKCWSFEQDATGLKAQFLGDDPATELSEVAQSDSSLNCPGPDVGV